MLPSYLITFVAILFLTTAVSKVFSMKSSLEKIKAFNLLDSRLLLPFLITMILVELTCSFLLFIGYWNFHSLLALTLLTSIYTIALCIKLIQGENHLNCGCGGILGDNEVNWKTLVRNGLIILSILTSAYFAKGDNQVIAVTPFTIFIVSFLIMAFNSMKEIFHYSSALNKLLTRVKVG